MSDKRSFGINLSKLIEEAVERYKVLNREQIQLMFYSRPNLKPESAKRQCQHKLKLLVQREILNVGNLLKDEPYYYYINTKKERKQIEHLIMTNWIFLWWQYKNPTARIVHVEYEKTDYQIVRPDLYVVFYKEDKDKKIYDSVFFEMDRTITNKFNKIQLYNQLYKMQYSDEWSDLTEGQFPRIIIATTNGRRQYNIYNQIKSENKGHRMGVYLLSKLKEELLNGKKNMVHNYLPII